MDNQDGTTMSNMDKDRYSQIQARVLKHMENSLIRGEKAESRILKEELEKLRREKAQKETKLNP